MKYSYSDDVKLVVEPQEFNKDSGKQILQYAVGGLLYTPAYKFSTVNNNVDNKFVARIVNKQYHFIKSIALDLEDSLGDDMVGFGKRAIGEMISKIADSVKEGLIEYNNIPLIFIRVRNANQLVEVEQMLGENIRIISGFNIPKFDKYCCDEYIDKFNKIRRNVENMTKRQSTLYMMPIIENKSAMYRQLRMDNLLYINDKLRSIQDNVLNIRVGGADFCSIFGIRRSMKHNIHEIGVVRSVLSDIMNVFGKSYIVSGPVWEYFEDINNKENTAWKEGLERELEYDRLNGFIGKTCIHPSQLHLIQKSLIVENSDYNDAMNILGMNPNIVGVSKGMISSRMNEVKTHTNWAKKIASLTHVYGVRGD